MNKFIAGKRDWLILIGYIALIYSTLPIMPRVVALFSSLFGQYFSHTVNLLIIVIIIIIFTFMFRRGSRRKKPISYIAAAFLFAAYLAILLFATPIIAEKMHLLEYGFLSCIALRVVKNARPPWKQNLFIILTVILIGYCDELIQKFTPGRVYETRDVILNIVSGVLGLFILRLYIEQKD